METYDSTVKLAQALGPGDVLVGVGPGGERLYRVHEVQRRAGKVVVAAGDQSVTFHPRDEVRVAHPDLAELHATRDDAGAESPTRTA
ncbi:hypothetical protein [Georgenia sp. Marseille-Q6866]